MLWLCLGVLLWGVVHLVPSIGRPLRTRLVSALGENGYKAAFAILIVTSIVLMVVGWRATVPSPLYRPPLWTDAVTFALMILAFILFGAAKQPTRIKQIVRHPQLTGLIVWSVAHLLSNGDSRSIILFGGLGIWALVEIFAINAREGEWVKPAVPSMAIEIRGLAISLAVFAAFFWLHPYYTGVYAIPR